MKRRTPLFAAMSPNGHVVHLATSGGRPACGASVIAKCRVHARVTCRWCAARHPDRAARLAGRPLVVGLDWSPLYRALGRAIEQGLREEPRVRVKFWPVLAPAERSERA